MSLFGVQDGDRPAHVRINSDSLKGSSTWDDLIYLLDEANLAGHIQFDVGLTTNQSGTFDSTRIKIEILAPTPGLAAKGPGGKDATREKVDDQL